MSVGPEEVLGAGGHLPMGLRLGQVKWVVGEWGCFSSLVPVEVHGSTRCVSLPGWEMLGAMSPLYVVLSRAIYGLA